MLENQLNQCFMVIFSFFIVRRSGNPGNNKLLATNNKHILMTIYSHKNDTPRFNQYY